MDEYIPLFDQEYTESVGGTFRVSIYPVGHVPEEQLYLVEKYDIGTNLVVEIVVLLRFAASQWIEPGAGESGKAREYGRLIERHLPFVRDTDTI